MIDQIKQLSEKMPAEAIQRTRASETRKGYDTDGYGYQYVVDRFNEVMGDAWGFTWDIIDHSKGAYRSGQPYHDVTVRVEIWVGDAKPRSCVGGHTSSNFADAVKGAITNGFKKTASFWGVGRDAYAGTIDDDNKPLPEADYNKVGAEKPKDERLEKIKSLPENIKAGFRVLDFNVTRAHAVCEAEGWDNEKILRHVNKLVDTQVKP